AEDRIRDATVTGVQTLALPILAVLVVIDALPGPVRILTEGVAHLDDRLQRGQGQGLVRNRERCDGARARFHELPSGEIHHFSTSVEIGNRQLRRRRVTSTSVNRHPFPDTESSHPLSRHDIPDKTQTPIAGLSLYGRYGHVARWISSPSYPGSILLSM